MTNTLIEGLIKEKDYAFKKLLFKIIKEFKLSTDELVLIVYFLNQDKPVFDINTIKEVTLLEDKDIMEAFSSLTSKGLINMSVVKEPSGKVSEVIDLGNVYKAMVSEIKTEQKEQTASNIFSIFEQEFGRPLTPIEFEIINAWLKSNMNEELIIGALKEATFNGVSNLRYIDKIIYEWGKKGFKSMNDVNHHLKTKEKEPTKVLFDYNWLDEDE